jgi:hypothetical protein
MAPNPSYFLAFSLARKLLLGVLPNTFRATAGCLRPQQQRSRGEALVASDAASNDLLRASAA